MDGVIVDTDTASDDAQALVLAVRSSRVTVEAVTVVAGNVGFDEQVANALYTLELAGSDAPVYPGPRRPLAKTHEPATAVHGPTGLGRLTADPTREAVDRYAVDALLDRVRDAPGELSVLALGPLTTLAEAVRREPNLNELLREVVVMGGAIDTRGNVTPAAEFNAWVDPDAARIVFRELETTLVDWGIAQRARLPPATLDRIADLDTPLARFFTDATSVARDDGLAQPDGLAAAVAAYPELIESTTQYRIAVDAREGPTRGYTLARDPDAVDGPASDESDSTHHDAPAPDEARAITRVVDAVDVDAFHELLVETLADGRPTPP